MGGHLHGVTRLLGKIQYFATIHFEISMRDTFKTPIGHYSPIPLDVNECQSNNGGCAQLCANQPGSHRCECSTGYVLDSDGRSCSGK